MGLPAAGAGRDRRRTARHAVPTRRRLAIGCDAENAGDAVDVLRAAALFVGIERDRLMDAFCSYRAARFGTGNDPRGRGDRQGRRQLGSLEIGKQADIVVHSTRGPQWLPISTDPVQQLIWASDGRSVSDVIVAGRHVVRDGACISVDVDSLREEAIARRNHFLTLRNS